MNHRTIRVAVVAILTTLGLLIPVGVAQAHHSPPSTVHNTAPGGYTLIGRNHDRIAQSNQGTLDFEAGIQVTNGKGRLWAKGYADSNEIGAVFKNLHYQELDATGRRVTQEAKRPGPVGPTHAAPGHRTVYYVGTFRDIHPDTRYFRVGFQVDARKSGTFLDPGYKCVASFMVRNDGALAEVPLC